MFGVHFVTSPIVFLCQYYSLADNIVPHSGKSNLESGQNIYKEKQTNKGKNKTGLSPACFTKRVSLILFKSSVTSP